jgi:hypothetical protein
MIITGKHIPRRTFLRAAGTSVALPFLDAMVPVAAGRRSPAEATTRLVCIEEVHGNPGCNDWGATQHLFAPEHVGRNFTMSESSSLVPLAPFQDYLTIVSNTDCRMAEAFTGPEIGGDHFRSTAVFLTQAHPKQTQGSDLYVGTSLDQIHAHRYGQDTPLPSLQLCIEPTDAAGGCWYNYHCAYTDAASWASPSEPLPMIRDPRIAFDRLFGAGGSDAERAVRRRTNASILDWITQEIEGLKRSVAAEDRQRIDQYLENVREVERRIEKVVEFNTSGERRALPDAPAGVPDSFEEHMQLMFDLQLLAFQTDMTRVTSFKIGRDASSRIFPESGVDKPFHASSHYGTNKEAILEYNRLCNYRMTMIAPFLEKLRNAMEGDAHLLDKTVVLWGSAMGDSNIHNHRRCPLLLIGRGNGALQGNVNLKAPAGTPMANAMLSLLHALGHEDMESFGDSTGEFSLSSPAGTAAENVSAGR